MGRDRPTARGPRDRHDRQPALRGSRPRSRPRSRAGRWRSCSTAARRSRPRSRPRGPGDVVVIAGKGADTEMELAGGSVPVRRSSRRPRGAGVIPLELERRRAARPADRAALGGRRHRHAGRLAAHRRGRPVRRGRRRRRLRRARARARRVGRARPAGRTRRARRDRRRPCAAARRPASSAITGSTGKTSTKDILFALCAPHAAHDRERGQLQQRDRSPADALPARGGHRDLHQRDGDARPRADRAAGRDRRGRTSA